MGSLISPEDDDSLKTMRATLEFVLISLENNCLKRSIDPKGAHMRYPVDRPYSTKNIMQMRLAERTLDDFWKHTSIETILKDASWLANPRYHRPQPNNLDRPLHRTPPWKEPEYEEKPSVSTSYQQRIR